MFERFGGRIAVIEQPNRKTLQIEIACDSPQQLKEFGGGARKLPRNWLKHFAPARKAQPIRIGDRQLIIPAGSAFGTGEHATTAMCLTMLKQHFSAQKLDRLNRSSSTARGVSDEPFGVWKFDGFKPSSFRCGAGPRPPATCTIVDLGTGSGILALAARLLGAQQVLGVDNDPIAIRTARQNAARNHIRGVDFRIADAGKLRGRVDVLVANLFSELLIKAVPNWRGTEKLILSGILRNQERDVTRALRANGFRLVTVRRRGKWIAMLATARARSLGAPRTAQRSVPTSAGRKAG